MLRRGIFVIGAAIIVCWATIVTMMSLAIVGSVISDPHFTPRTIVITLALLLVGSAAFAGVLSIFVRCIICDAPIFPLILGARGLATRKDMSGWLFFRNVVGAVSGRTVKCPRCDAIQ